MPKPYDLQDADFAHDPNHPFLVTLNGYGLAKGAHPAEQEGSFCLLECAALARGKAKTDSPDEAGLPDFRAWNDAYPTTAEGNAARTRNGARVALALWDWPDWSKDRRVAFAKALAFGVIAEVLPFALDAAAYAYAAAYAAAAAADAAADADAAYAAAAYAAAAAAAAATADAAARLAPLNAFADVVVRAALHAG